MSRTYFEKGKCDVCGTSYDKEAYQVDNEPGSNVGRYTVDCPKCKYNPGFLNGIKSVLEKDEEGILVKNGKLRINSEKLSKFTLMSAFFLLFLFCVVETFKAVNIGIQTLQDEINRYENEKNKKTDRGSPTTERNK